MDRFDRYQRQMLLPDWGEAGQQRLLGSHVLLVGCGALGTVIADALVRAGVGRLTVVDRDVVELTNLHRQVLYTQADAEALLPKAEAARRRLSAINADVHVDAQVADFAAANAERLAAGADVLVDGSDNFATRLLLNDVAIKHGRPYVYGGAVGTRGTLMTILPHAADGDAPRHTAFGGACLRCILGDEPAEAGPTCDTVGVLGPVAGIIGLHEATEALKILLGRLDRVDRRMRSIDLWSNTMHAATIDAARDPSCACCAQRRYDYLEGRRGESSASLCGRDAVQISAPADSECDLATLARRLEPLGAVTANPYLVRAELPFQGGAIRLSVFADGRAIVQGVSDPASARAACARFLGR
ncbi:MAG: thiazole biosynthesis adenylyltransferase ThiF [Alphaproteobacteria bacterium]|jgi:adenylyltransferase/sulfurtransferase|nr:thiazole biosynthesis adenylyltransferase ThiF [Alphaproteobacteria bacterium]